MFVQFYGNITGASDRTTDPMIRPIENVTNGWYQ